MGTQAPGLRVSHSGSSSFCICKVLKCTLASPTLQPTPPPPRPVAYSGESKPQALAKGCRHPLAGCAMPGRCLALSESWSWKILPNQ